MADHLPHAVGRTWVDGRPWEFLTRLTEIDNRMGGQPGEHRAGDLVTEWLSDAGIDPTVEPFEMWRWDRGGANLTVHVERSDRTIERSFEAVGLPYSPGGDVRAPLADLGHGTPEEVDNADVAGSIAVASTTTPPDRERFVHRMEKYGLAAAAGARAFVFANHQPGQLPPTGTLSFDGEASIPAVGVSYETGEWLRDYATNDRTARLQVDALTERGTSRNVVGTLGPDTDEKIILLAHVDAHDIAEGALDNGCGIATALTATNLLTSFEDTGDLDSQVRVAALGCEEIGLLGAESLADSIDVGSVRAVVNVDGAGRHRNLKAYTHGSDYIHDLITKVCERAGQPVVFEETPHPYSDHWPFLRNGVPAVQLHSEPPDGGGRGRGWGHTAADTRDKVDIRDLRAHAILTALIVRELARTDIGRRDPAALADELRGANAERGMRAAGVWPNTWD